MVALSKSGERRLRGFESHPLRHILPRPERSPRGLGRRTGNAVWGNPSRVRIPPSPPELGVSSLRRARRGTSGALYLQSAPAGLNPLPRPRRSETVGPKGVEDRVPRVAEP